MPISHLITILLIRSPVCITEFIAMYVVALKHVASGYTGSSDWPKNSLKVLQVSYNRKKKDEYTTERYFERREREETFT